MATRRDAEARISLATTLFEQAEMNSAIFSPSNGDDKELVLGLSKDENELQGVLQSSMEARVSYASVCNTGSAQEGATEPDYASAAT